MIRENQCRYCCRFANDCMDVELRPDGETWKQCYPSRICGECRKNLNQTRLFRYLKRPATIKRTQQAQVRG